MFPIPDDAIEVYAVGMAVGNVRNEGAELLVPLAGWIAQMTVNIAADFHTDAATLPAVKGAYVLLIDLPYDVAVRLPRRPDTVLAAGCYLYSGSANGMGGIKARVGRHMRDGKTIRWHIDQLTVSGKVIGAWVFPGGDECELVARLSTLPTPIQGFGSSDCRECVSHLLAWPDGVALPFGNPR